jgi:hypothetical protein
VKRTHADISKVKGRLSCTLETPIEEDLQIFANWIFANWMTDYYADPPVLDLWSGCGSD